MTESVVSKQLGVEKESLARRFTLFFRVFTGSVLFGRKGTILWDSWEMWIMQIFITPPAEMAFFYLLAISVYHSPAEAQYTVIGNAVQAMSFAAVFAVANITSQDKWQGTLQNLIVTPANRMALFIGRASFQIFMSAIITVAAFVYADYVFGISFANANLLALAATIVLTSVMMISFGLLISSIGLFMRTAMIVANIFLFLTMLVSGVNFPVSSLPALLQPVSWAIPMTYGVLAARMSIQGASLFSLGTIFLQEIIDGIAVLLVGYLLMKSFERLARSSGRLEEY
ncbi:MAG: ABC transporter permease [Nitrososphaerota archaeon]|nr:ABC transporter permease [Nitrososphaerota archaeon]